MLLTPLGKVQSENLRERFSTSLLESPTDFNLAALRNRGWIAVPVDDNVSEIHASNIATAAVDLGAREGLAVTTEPDVHVEAVRVPLTQEGILTFDANCMLRAFILVAEDEKFALLDEGDYYYVIAGLPGFVERAIGDVGEARGRFLRFANRSQWPQKTREFLLGIHSRYLDLSDSSAASAVRRSIS